MNFQLNIKDIISGFITPIMIIATSLSYAVLIFSGPLSDHLAIGAGFSLIGAGVTAIIFAVASGLPFAISGPDSKAVAVMASLVVMIGEDLHYKGKADVAGVTILAALVLGTLIVGVSSYICGALKLGRWIRFMPYPVIGGFMAASGWFLFVGAVRVLTQEPISLKLLTDLSNGAHSSKLIVGVLFALGLHIAQNSRFPLAFPTLLVCGGASILAGILYSGTPLNIARESGWLIKISANAVDAPTPWLIASASKIELQEIFNCTGQYLALVTVVIATLLLSIMAIEVETKNDIDLDHELRLNGLANILAGLAGGTVGTLSVSRTLFSFRIGARGRISGLLVGALCLFPLALGPSALGFVPMPILGAVLIQLGGSMLYEWLFKSWRLMQPADYVQLFIIFLTIVSFDFVAGVGVGIITACVTFVVNTARVRLVKHAMNRGNFSSRVDRPIYQIETLQKNGARIQIMWLHGFVFFGSAHHLLSNIKSIISSSPQPCYSLILDFKQVLGIDSSAAMTLVKLRHLSEREGFQLVFSNLSEYVAQSLRLGGVVNQGEDDTCRIFNNLDAALEWCEDSLLKDSDDENLLSHTTSEWLKSELGSVDRVDLLEKYIEIKKFEPGDILFNQGETADSLYILSTGRVTILFKTPEGSELRLRSMLGHTLLGEMGLYRNALRGASVVADEPTIVYKVTRKTLQHMEDEAPELAHAFHKFVVRTLAARLDFSNREVAGLQR